MSFLIKKLEILAIKYKNNYQDFLKLMTKKKVFNFIKTPCGQAKYIELEANKTLLGKFRLLWFILIASIRDWNIKE